MNNDEDVSDNSHPLKDWLATLPTTFILLLVIFLGLGEAFHSQLLNIGEKTWQGYYKLRGDIPKPECDPNPNIDAQVKKRVEEQKKDQDGLGLLEQQTVDREAIRKSLLSKRQECRNAWALYRKQKKKLTPFVRYYRSLEKSIAYFKQISINYTRHLLVLLIVLTAITATVTRHHVVLRPQKTKLDHWVSTSAQLLANSLLLISVLFYWYNVYTRSDSIDTPYIYALWIGGFSVLTAATLYRLWAGVPDESWPRGELYKTVTTIPLYAYICIVGAIWFFVVEGYFAGMVVQLRKMERFPSLFLKVGLYVWTGMMLKWTQLTKLVLDVIRPWKLPPEYVVIALVMLCAFPTAYSGASGIFVIAAGAVIYEELRRLGTRRELSIATTAMSGSGVFLEPCLIVVIISALNKQITTQRLFHYGFYVYLLMGLVVATLVLLTRRNKLTFRSPSEALKPCLKSFLPLIPYILSGAFVIAGFYYLLNVPFNEYTAPDILPFILLIMIFYDQWMYGSEESHKNNSNTSTADEQVNTDESFWSYSWSVSQAIRRATSETTEHIGSLLTLMATTMILSGVVGRSRVMTLVPTDFASVWTTMLFLVFIMVVIGMTMDPYGAVILVSASFAPVAYQNGIDPVHFWLVVLVAFELGYLTPPVALNQQFTRMVIGEEEYEAVADSENKYDSFWRNYEYLLLPITAMAIVLFIVAFFPLLI